MPENALEKGNGSTLEARWISTEVSQHQSTENEIEKGSHVVAQTIDARNGEESALPIDANIADWNSDDDRLKPMNWTNVCKAKNIVVICYKSFLT
jgi:hypothetical protein